MRILVPANSPRGSLSAGALPLSSTPKTRLKISASLGVRALVIADFFQV